MKIDETLYNEYANFKIENKELLENLKTKADDIYYTFGNVYEVIEFLYNMLVEDENYGEEQDVVFKAGYFHFVNTVNELKELLNEVYDGNIEEMNYHASEINLLFNTQEFQSEIISLGLPNDIFVTELLNFDKKLYELIRNKQLVDDSLYERLNYLVAAIYEKLELDFMSINSIFVEIAEQLKLI